MRNWQSGQFEVINTHGLGFSDEWAVRHGLSAADRVRGGDRRVELSIRHVVVATFTAVGFESFVDRVEIEVH